MRGRSHVGLALAAAVTAGVFGATNARAEAPAEGGTLPPPSRRTVVAGGDGPASVVPPPPAASPTWSPALPPAPPFLEPVPMPAPPPRAVAAPTYVPVPPAPRPAVPDPTVPGPTGPVAAGRRPASVPSASMGASWHVRVGGGATFGVIGEDPPEPGACAGADVGVTFAGGLGVDAFYRGEFAQFLRKDDPALEKDGGVIQHVGVKLTYETPRTPGASFGLYAGAGPTYTWTADFASSSGGVGAFGEAGVVVHLSDRLRLRLGAEVRAFESDVGRNLMADDGQDRWVYTVSPVVFLQFDL